jgi:hypothetical protein
MAGLGRKVFSPGEVLTATNVQNNLMDQAVQVYAGTAARGSAIGTATTEGMVSWLEDVNKLQVATGTASWVDVYPAVPLSGSLLQVIHASTTANTSGNTAIPFDNTIPQITEGTEMLTATITPKSATSNLIIQAAMYFGETSNQTNYMTSSLFRDSTANALATSIGRTNISGGLDSAQPALIIHSVASSSTSATTFKVRCGSDGNFTIILNGVSTPTSTYQYPVYGGTYRSTLTIWEVQG